MGRTSGRTRRIRRRRGAAESDGETANFDDPLETCLSTGGRTPCGLNSVGAGANQGKAFGMSAGQGDAPNVFAWLLMAPETTPTVTKQTGGGHTIGEGRTH